MQKQIDDATRQEAERKRIKQQIEEANQRTASMREKVKEIVALYEGGHHAQR